jgi:SRSO17 transposase
VLLDRRLYLPKESWIADPERCAAAGVPPEVVFKTRSEQVREMIEATLAAGVPFAWFTADEEFGQNPGLCDYLETSRIPYVMAVPKSTHVTGAAGKTLPLESLVGRLPPNSWQRRSCGIGSKGFRVYDWALIDSDHPDHQYLIRRSINDKELAFYRWAVSIGHGDTVLRDQLIEDLDRLLPA